MKCSLCLLLLFYAFCIEGRADDFSGASPSGKLYYESKKEKEFYIWSPAEPKKRFLLYDEKDGAIQAAAISPDDVWVALESGSGSMGHFILFFKRQTGLEFKQVHQDLPADEVGTLALVSKGIKENFLDHFYLHPIDWSEDSKWLTVALDASGVGKGERIQIRNWRCRYNLVSHELEKVKSNPGKIEVNGKEKEDTAIEETGVNAHPKAEETTPESTRNDLARADVRLNQVYAALRLKLGASEKEALKREQIKWLAERDKITDEVKRLEFIEQRARELEQRGAAKK